MTQRSLRSHPRRRRTGLFAVAAALVLAAGFGAAWPQAAAARTAPLVSYRGLGTWVDLYDAKAWSDPAAAVQDMAAHGVRTLFIETANYHWPTAINKQKALDVFIQQCHLKHLYVVAWYLPGFKDLKKDLARSKAAIDYRTSDGQKFDSFALDIEDSGVKPAAIRSARLKTLSDEIRAAVGPAYPLGGIIPSPAGMALHGSYWPGFPYKMVAGVYDVIVPMGYYTYHGDGAAQAYSETLQNVQIVRTQTGNDAIPIHVIGGLADKSSSSETTAYVRALRETGCLGGSMYDWSTTNAADWAALASVRFNPVQRPSLPRDLGYAAPMGNCPGDTTHPKEVFYKAAALSGDRVLHVRLWDVQADEVRLLVNWQDAGALVHGPDHAWSKVRSLAIPATLLNAKGRNVIGFVAAGDAPAWHRWGVRDVTLVKP